MKNIKWLVIPLSLWLLTACGNANDEGTNTQENAPTEGTTDNNGTANNGTTNNDTNGEGTTNNGTTNNNTNDEGATNNGATADNNAVNNADNSFGFTDFSLDVDYSATQDFEVEYENEQSGVEASYEDEVNNEQLYGNDAYDRITPLFQSLKFDKNTSDDEVISQVLNAFGLSEDYQKFELEIRFADGTEKEYRKEK